MSEIVPVHTRLAPSTPEAIDKVRLLAEGLATLPQIPFVTEHLLHAGMYTRTVRLPAGTVCAAVLIRPPTVLILMGEVDVWSNGELIRTSGYSVLPGSAGRKIAFTTHSDVGMSMIFPTDAQTVEEAQKQFTVEHELLPPLSKADAHIVLITGE
jgi:hypothetical protein